jgi:deoxyuridine 5'-triphosphate nucleotidohydrolase
MKLIIKKLHPDAIIPTYGTDFAAGLDLSAYGEHIIEAKTRKLIPIGICIQWMNDNLIENSNQVENSNPNEYYFRIASRSGLAVKHNIDIGAGVVDSDYRGEIKVCFINNSDQNYTISHGDRIAQGILEKIKRFSKIEVVDELDETKRGNGGFGSTGFSSIV